MSRADVVRIAAAQYPVTRFDDWDGWAQWQRDWVSDAAAEGARLLLFPEYCAMELASLFGDEVALDLHGQLDVLQSLLPQYRQQFAALAGEFSVTIQAGTFPVRLDDGRMVNRAMLFRPDGSEDFQDKLIMTRFEREQWGMSGGDGLRVLDSEFGPLGISICYDSEFPAIARRQAELGAVLILVPSCTDTAAGYHRVRIGSQARALENQCYVVQSPLVGDAPWSAAVDVNEGAAGVYTPADSGFPDNGVLAMGEYNRPQWLYADLQLAKVAQVRRDGQVFNFRDSPAQDRFLSR
ncbi:carbon-nitrogen hydrolase family protein [Granulosicoccaceae sp. 1_MG-2023]|nr:carbon-nitrogen hydrolase family protein [Granulosicoccaceae sp. 1_MG-2023]